VAAVECMLAVGAVECTLAVVEAECASAAAVECTSVAAGSAVLKQTAALAELAP